MKKYAKRSEHCKIWRKPAQVRVLRRTCWVLYNEASPQHWSARRCWLAGCAGRAATAREREGRAIAAP